MTEIGTKKAIEDKRKIRYGKSGINKPNNIGRLMFFISIIIVILMIVKKIY